MDYAYQYVIQGKLPNSNFLFLGHLMAGEASCDSQNCYVTLMTVTDPDRLAASPIKHVESVFS